MTDSPQEKAAWAEYSLLEALLRKNDLIVECDLRPEEFSSAGCGEVYRLICDRINEQHNVDLVTVLEELRTQGRTRLLNVVTEAARYSGTDAMFPEYVSLIRGQAQRRKAEAIAQGLRHSIQTDGIGAIDDAIRDLMDLTSTRTDDTADLKTTLIQTTEELDEIYTHGLTGVTTGLTKLDDALGGLHDTDLTIIGARPSMGKTALMMSMALPAAGNVPVGIVSAEQPRQQLGLRILSSGSGISVHDLRRGRVSEEGWGRIAAHTQKVKDRPVYIFDRPGPNIADILRIGRKWKHRHNIGALYVDYIQRIKADGERRKDEMRVVVQALKSLGRELDIPVVALSQVGRDVERRANKRPMMSDLSDASEIEQEADQVILVYRDEVYHEDSPDKGIAELLIEKNRHGPVGTIRVAWIKEQVRFADLSSHDEFY